MNIRTAQDAANIAIRAGISQPEIAKRCKVSQPTISRIISGEHTDPRGSILIALNDLANEVEAAGAAPQSQAPEDRQ